MHTVPTTREVVPGALVNIVLKADQPTGRTVQGAVSQLLTRGNHPRGIKVRLTDGRVGRVQSMAGGAAPTASRPQHDGDMGDAGGGLEPVDGANGGRRHYHRHGWAQGGDREQPPSAQAVGLDAYIKPTRKRGKGRNSGNATTDVPADDNTPRQPGHADSAPAELEESTCPVCGDFRGDAPALTHHVQSHFDD